MSDFHADYKQQLVTAAGALFAAPAARPKRGTRRPRRLPLVAAIALGVLLLATAALAASQIIGFGSPVTATHVPGRERPSASSGVGVPVAGANGSPASVQPLAISVADPGGGLPWGMRVVRTTRGLLCLQIGRLLDGRLGVLGQDGEFHDDGLFHELPATVLGPSTCISPSVWTILSDAGLPAAGALQSPTTSCVAPWLRTWTSGPKPCPARDERLIGFGLLGPDAVSVSYVVDGQLHSVATASNLGAYLIVLRVPPDLEQNVPALGGKRGLLGGFPIGAGRGEVVSRLLFRFGGHLCQTGFDRQPGGPPQCKSSVAFKRMCVPAIPRGLHTPVALKARSVSGGYDLQITFAAPAAVTNASTAYGVEVIRPSSSVCGRGGIWGQSIERDVARGQVLHVSEFVPQAPGCHGVVHGRVILGSQRYGGFFDSKGLGTIGRFSFALP
jgi:hypothetical protein